jgi:hypothetical protein
VRIFAVLAALIACAAALSAIAAAGRVERLALMPLPRQTLGTGSAALALQSDSGVDTNADAARHAADGVTAAELAGFGRISGYTLDYWLPQGSTPQSLLGVQTIAELYRDTTTATHGLAFWRGVTKKLNGTTTHGVTVSLAPFAVRVGDRASAYAFRYTRAGKPLFYLGDIVFRTGDMLGAVFVTLRDEASVRGRARELAHKLATRMNTVAAGATR